MENRYFKSELIEGLTSYRGVNKGVMLSFYSNGHTVSFDDEPLSIEYLKSVKYEEITRTEFMEAYLPIAEKMNNKIGEL